MPTVACTKVRWQTITGKTNDKYHHDGKMVFLKYAISERWRLLMENNKHTTNVMTKGNFFFTSLMETFLLLFFAMIFQRSVSHRHRRSGRVVFKLQHTTPMVMMMCVRRQEGRIILRRPSPHGGARKEGRKEGRPWDRKKHVNILSWLSNNAYWWNGREISFIEDK